MTAIAKHLFSFNLQLRGTIMVVLSATLFGFMGFFGTKLFILNLSLGNMLFWRFLMATCWVFGGLLNTKNSLRAIIENQATLIKVLILGAISYSGSSAFYFMASKQIGTGLAMVIFFSFPVFVALFSWLLGSWRMNKIAAIALLAVILGLICLKGENQHALNIGGILFGIIAAMSYATYVYGSQYTIKNIDSRSLTFIVCLGNTFIFLFLSLCTNSLTLPGSLSAWIYIFAIAIIATALPIQFLLDGLQYINPVKASVLSVIEPLMTLLIGQTFLNETISSIQLMGVLIILSGAILIQFEKVTHHH